jgi:hypothetical protein
MTFQFLYFLIYDFLLMLHSFLRLYKVICYTKILLDQIVFINPYVWPISAFKLLAEPYFKFWIRLIPERGFRRVGVNFSVIIGFEVLNIAIQLSAYVLRLWKNYTYYIF